MSTVQLTESKIYVSQIQMHTGTQNYDVSLAKEFQEHMAKKHHKDGVIDHGKSKNDSWK